MVDGLVLALRFTVPPTHIGPLLVGPVDAGTAFTDTVVVYEVGVVQPLPVPCMVTVYVAVAVGVVVGFCTVEDDRFGPLHAQLVVDGLVLAVRFTVPPTHIGPLFVGPVDTGTALTETVVV